MLSTHGILAGHTIPTRETNCLDHVMLKTSKIKFSAKIAVLNTTTTDHYTVLLVLSKQKKYNTIKKSKITTNYEEALKQLKNKNLALLLHCNDPEKLIDDLIYKLNESLKDNTTVTPISKKTVL
ncbi:hypothetical protein JYU34_011899 [Plutella xylostella]|uniref:Uncharacterized protein n=1 Tax=Plutella xylostella TaxID=51655 RepID=A0ABQ7QDS6_PLUXY|nr:hypothetical protein JYU34_011899 [Plutella xylostella]